MTENHRVYLGLGSNLKHPKRQLTTAIKHLSRLPSTEIMQCAPWYQTPPWGVIQQPDFVNTVIQISTRLTPLQLLRHIKIIEYRLMSRQVNKRWHSRNIDIDILYYVQYPFKRSNLTLPHPHISERCFVLRPLFDIKPTKPPPSIIASRPLPRMCCRDLKQQKNALQQHLMWQIRGTKPVKML